MRLLVRVESRAFFRTRLPLTAAALVPNPHPLKNRHGYRSPLLGRRGTCGTYGTCEKTFSSRIDPWVHPPRLVLFCSHIAFFAPACIGDVTIGNSNIDDVTAVVISALPDGPTGINGRVLVAVEVARGGRGGWAWRSRNRKPSHEGHGAQQPCQDVRVDLCRGIVAGGRAIIGGEVMAETGDGAP